MPSRTDIVVVTKSEGEMDPTVEDKYSYQSLNVKLQSWYFILSLGERGKEKTFSHWLLIFGLSNIFHDCIIERF